MKKNYKDRRTKDGGFTLLEVIAAMILLSLVTVIIAQGYSIGIDAWRRGEAETSETQRLRVLSGLLYQQIKSAYPYLIDMDEEKTVLFRGEPDSIIFVTTLTDSSFGGFKWVRYSYSDGTLKYKEGILPDKEFSDKTEGKEKIVDRDMEEVRFWYLSPEEGEWNESWDFGEDLPAAVKVKISYFEPFTINLPMGLRDDENKSDEETT